MSVQKAREWGHCPKGRTPRFHPDDLRDVGENHFVRSYICLFIHAFGQLVFRQKVIEHLLCAWHCAGCRGAQEHQNRHSSWLERETQSQKQHK